MSAIEAAVEPEDESTQRVIEAALEDIARATSFYDFEHAWVAGLRTASASDGTDGRDRVLAAAGRRLHALGPLQDDVARRRWLDQIADEVQLRGDGHLRTDLAALAAAELRETFALAADDMKALQAWAASGAHLNKFSAQHTRAANRIRDLGRIAESLRGSGLLALCSEDEYELAADLARAMKPPVHLVPTVPESLRVSRGDLIRWAQSDSGDKELPRLVRSLIAETEPSAEWIDMPAGTGVAMPGWDGVVRCARGNRFVPVGTSSWELTAKQNGTRDKAASDYAKRLAQSTPDERAETAYVSVACAPWTKARTFTSERSGTSDFGRVSALNVDQLEDWLACAVATTIWMREQIGRPVAGIRLLSNWWKSWLAATTTPLDEGFVLAGREKIAAEFRDRCAQTGGIVTVGGQVHRDEIIAFAAAALGGGGSEGAGISRALFVDDHDAAQRLFAQEALSTPGSRPPGDPALTIMVPSADYARHLPAGSPHRMIVPTPGSPQATVTLDAVDSEAVAKRLESAGLELHQAHELAGVARTSLIALRRCLAEEPALHTPKWAKGHIDAPMRRCLLLGGWNGTRDSDREIVERMTGRPYIEVTDLLCQIDSADAPLANVDQQWYSVSPAATWVLMRAHLTRDDVNEFAEVAHDVLTDADPVHELTVEDAISARMHGAGARYSRHLRQGIATTLALAGSLASPVEATSQVSNMAASVTGRLLRSAVDDATPRTWTAIAEVLPLLAEAAPEAVLEALRASTLTMFADRAVGLFGFSIGSPHVPILWALETIAWSPEHLTGTVDVLARLAEIDPGGQASNRPAESLASIMCPWLPYTSASTDDRLAAVRMLRRHHESVAWPLMLSMLPNDRRYQSPGVRPKFRDWRNAAPTATWHDVGMAATAVSEMLAEDVGMDPARWVDLLARLTNLSEQTRSRLVDALQQIAGSEPSEHFKATVWPNLRDVVARHRQHNDADWALSDAELAPLADLLPRLCPAAFDIRYGHLFSSALIYLDGVHTADGWEAFQAVLQPKQDEAVDSVLIEDGLKSLIEFAASVEQPHPVGTALGRCNPSLDTDVLATMEAAPESTTSVALGYFGQRFAKLGWEGIDRLVREHDLQPQVVADLMRAPPPVEMPWERVDALGSDVAAAYWDRVSYYDLGNPRSLEQRLTVCRRLQEAKRFELTLMLLALGASKHSADLEFAEGAAACLEQWILHRSADPADPEMIRWALTTLFGALERQRDRLGSGRIAMLEWQYYPILQDDPEFRASNLHREMARSPDLFARLVELAFMPAHTSRDERRAPNEQQRQMALNATQVLWVWPESQFSPGDAATDGLDPDSLQDWIRSARGQLAALDRANIGDEMIGTALAASPADPNGDWPGIAVRNLLEQLECQDVERGLDMAIRNRRGSTVRAPTDGGDQERELAESYRKQSRRFKEWPRTAAIFDRLARGYEREADVEDREAETHRRGLPL